MTDTSTKVNPRTVPDGRRVTKIVKGYAKIWFCDPSHWSGINGCGLFMFFKPEVNSPSFKCPNCSGVDCWNEIEGELAEFEVLKLEEPDEVH